MLYYRSIYRSVLFDFLARHLNTAGVGLFLPRSENFYCQILRLRGSLGAFGLDDHEAGHKMND